jgi:hypothetical protein
MSKSVEKIVLKIFREGVNDEQKGKLRNGKRHLLEYLIKQHQVSENKDKIFKEIRVILDRIMNPASHVSGEAMYERELQNAIAKVHELKALLGARKFSEILKKGDVVVNQSVVLLMKCVQAKKNATEESGKNLYLFVAFFYEQYRF